MYRHVVRSWIAPIALAGAMAGCSSVQINYDFDPSVTFSTFHTYMWKDTSPVKDASVDQRIVRAVDLALASKKLTKVETGADLSVTYHAAVEKGLDVTSCGYAAGPAYGYGGWYGYGYGGYGAYGGTTTTQVREVKQGTLAIDLVQVSSNNLVFRGVASAEIGPPGTNTGLNLNDIVQQIFGNYPPKN